MNFCTAGCSSGFNRDCRVQEGLLDVEGVVRVAIRMYWWEPKNVGSQFRVDCLDQNLDLTVTKSKTLEAVRIIRMMRHVIRTDRSGELGVSQ